MKHPATIQELATKEELGQLPLPIQGVAFYLVRHRNLQVNIFKVDFTGRVMAQLSLAASLKVRNHSPTGFEFGYGGSGPRQSAVAITLDWLGMRPDFDLITAELKNRLVSRGEGKRWLKVEDFEILEVLLEIKGKSK